jgi:hypothetical protein
MSLADSHRVCVSQERDKLQHDSIVLSLFLLFTAAPTVLQRAW